MSRVFLFREARKAGAARKEYSKAFVHLELPTIAESPRSLKETENIILVQKEVPTGSRVDMIHSW